MHIVLVFIVGTNNQTNNECFRIMCPVFTLKTYNQTNYVCLPKFLQTDDAPFSTKTANDSRDC